MKRRVSIVGIGIGLAIVLIPTFIMLSFYFSNRDIPVAIRQAEKLVLTLPDGESVTATGNGKHSELLALFCDMTLDAKSVEKLPEESEDSQIFIATYSSAQSKLTYRFYISENPAYCYFVATDKSVHRIASEKAAQFLATDYCQSVYRYAVAPTVIIKGQAASASKLDWSYRKIDGSYQRADCSTLADKPILMELGVLMGGISVECTPTPDSIRLLVTDEEGNEIFVGTCEEFASFSVKQTTQLQVQIDVEWKKDDKGTAPFAGSATYYASGTMHAPAEFAVSKNEVRPGEVFTLSGINVADPSAISVTISPSVDFRPVFVEQQGSVMALMTLGFPVAYMTDCTYTITVSCDALVEDAVFEVTVQKQSYQSFLDYIKKDTAEDTYSLKYRNEFTRLVEQIVSMDSVYDYDMEKITFGEGVQTPDKSRFYEYGASVKIMATGAEYRALDTMYCVYSASKPISVANGTVVYVGETALSGKMLVIDHGNGIRSWYCNLKQISVAVGDTVTRGQVIGACGGDGFNGQGGLNMHVALTLHNQALDLKIAIEDGIVY